MMRYGLMMILMLTSLYDSGAFAQVPASHLPSGRAPSPSPETPRPREERGTNDELPSSDLWLQTVRRAEGRDTVIDRIGKLGAPALGMRRLAHTAGVTGGEYKVFRDVPADFHVGSTGAGPCIGLILTTPPVDGKRTFYVFHFNAGNRPFSTIEKLGPFPNGTRAAVFGGDASEGSDQTLKSVMQYLDREVGTKRVAFDGYSKSAGLWVDRDGKYGTFGIEPWGTKPKGAK